ncbi:zinc finger protein 37 homolog isoform X1 [Anopheles albimanus]|uniref:zinc finger protein 37 homolog isoform X1 n=1 Tax=Anopheles albimanus TaxID=7167 RepID=UPI0016414544|nr:zinc finger protein 37 homolog isoform X1 [Anopheles albimanus]
MKQLVCRLCLAPPADQHRLLFVKSQEPDYVSIIREIVRLAIREDDELPKRICLCCATKLTRIQEDVKGFRETEEKLRASLVEETVAHKQPTESIIEHDERPEHDPFDTVGSVNDKADVPQQKSVDCVRRSSRVRCKVAQAIRSPSIVSEKTTDDRRSEDESDSEASPLDSFEISSSNPSASASDRKKTIRGPASSNTKQSRGKRRKLSKSEPKREDGPTLRDYKCYICSSGSLGSQKALLDHFATHVDRVPYTCERCVMKTVVITRVRALNTHLKMHEQPIKCDYCDRRYSNASGKYYHTQFYHLGGGAPCIIHCKVCGKQCGSQDALRKHMKYHTTALKCRKCDKVFNHPNKLRNHELSHDENAGYECVVCKKVLQTIESYDVHLKKHTQERSYQCSLCPKKFNTSCNLILHVKVHAKNDNYRPTRSWLEHYTIVSREPLKYKCNHCDRYETDKVNNMISHLQAHFKEYECDRCKRLFATAKQLRAHYPTHTGEKPERCQHCGKCFSNKNSLRTHLRTHDRETAKTDDADNESQKNLVGTSVTSTVNGKKTNDDVKDRAV